MKTWLILATLLFATGDAIARQGTETPLQAPVKSANDARQYGYLELPNRLRVLLVSDPEANKAAAALSIGVGASSEPDDRPGLAHFLEHMLFMGTRKYPGVEDYGRFISGHGGQTNAYTASNRTVYYFSVDPDELEPALDRFAQFFIAPLFDARYVEREKHAVNSEYQLKLKDDSRRVQAAIKQAYNPKSPYSRFSVGNLDTLADRPGDKVRDDLIAFYRQHYSANIMGLTLIGRESLETLRRLATGKFSAIPNHDARRYRPTPDSLVLPAKSLPLREDIVPLKDIHQLSIVFPLPSAQADFREMPLYYLSNLIGDEGEGSLHALLYQRGWITLLSAGSDDIDAVQGQFSVTMNLTPEGMRHIPGIQRALFDYIRLLRDGGIEAWRYREQQRLSELDFRYAEKESPFDYAPALAARLLEYPPGEVIRGGQVLQRFDADKIRRYLDHLRPDNAFVTLVDRSLKTDRIEPYYQVGYALRRPPPDLPKALPERVGETALHLPRPNPFVPEHPALKPVAQASPEPVALERRPGFSLWHQQDASFGVPRASVDLALYSPVATDTAAHAVAMTLYARLVDDQLNALTYPAELAGLSFSVSPTREGLELRVYGYDEKLPLLFDKVLAALQRPELAADRFAVHKEKLRRELENSRHDRAYLQVFRALLRGLVQPSWSPRQKLDALQTLDLAQLRDYIAGFYSRADVKLLAHGNLGADEARALAQRVRNGLLADSRLQTLPEPRLILPEPGHLREIAYPVDHPDSVIAETLLDTDTSAAAQARWKLLAQLLQQPFYTQLRTEQQLGYMVTAQAVDMLRHPGLLLLVQSSKVDVDELGRRIDAFRTAFPDYLAKLDEAEFTAGKAGLIATLLRKDETLHERSERYFSALTNRREDFDFRRKVAAEVEKLQRDELLAFYRKQLLERPRRARAWSAGTRFGKPKQQP